MTPQQRAERPRVLVAEDDAALRRLLEIRLGATDFEVRTVADGADALATIGDFLPKVFVCDVMMPRVSGLTVCKDLRAQAEYAELPIILLTARVFDEDIEEVLRLGGITFMNKPFNLDELLANIYSALHGDDAVEGIRGSDRLGWLRRPEATPTNQQPAPPTPRNADPS